MGCPSIMKCTSHPSKQVEFLASFHNSNHGQPWTDAEWKQWLVCFHIPEWRVISFGHCLGKNSCDMPTDYGIIPETSIPHMVWQWGLCGENVPEEEWSLCQGRNRLCSLRSDTPCLPLISLACELWSQGCHVAPNSAKEMTSLVPWGEGGVPREWNAHINEVSTHHYQILYRITRFLTMAGNRPSRESLSLPQMTFANKEFISSSAVMVSLEPMWLWSGSHKILGR